MTEPNSLFFDRYSVVHAAWGAVLQASRIPVTRVVLGAAAFELVENKFKEHAVDIWPDSAPDGWQNAVGDVASVTAGYYAAEALAKLGPGGRAAAVGLVALAGAIWMASITRSTRQGGWATR